jgi:RNA polymerase sigma-70 factor (ECF subfamily)
VRSEDEANFAVERYADTVRRICFIHLENHHDAENVFQDVFLKYIQSDMRFENEEHEKAWLIRVSINCCKDVIKNFFRRNVGPIDGLLEEPACIPEESYEILGTVLKLPEKYRNVIYLFYYERYTAAEIAKILGQRENTIYTWLSRAKAGLREFLAEEDG